MLFDGDLRGAIQAVLFVSAEPMPAKKIAGILDIKEKEVRDICADMMEEENKAGGFLLLKVAGGYTFSVNPKYNHFVEKIYKPKYNSLSNAALETLSIIAYRQPVTRGDIEKIRGVNSDRVVLTLSEKGLINELGRKEAPGKPILYGTTNDFLKYFGLNSIKELPEIEKA